MKRLQESVSHEHSIFRLPNFGGRETKSKTTFSVELWGPQEKANADEKSLVMRNSILIRQRKRKTANYNISDVLINFHIRRKKELKEKRAAKQNVCFVGERCVPVRVNRQSRART